MSEKRFADVVSLDAQTAAATSGTAADFDWASREVVVSIVWSAGAAAGQIIVESASDPAYAGSWAQQQVVNWTAASSEDEVRMTGAFKAVRARIASAVTSGTVTVTIGGN